jgi:hypothetical protein
MQQRRTRVHHELRRRGWRLTAGALVMSAIGVSACGSGTASPTVPRAGGSSVTTISQSHAMLLVVQCLRQHGIVNLPDPTVVSSGPARGQSVYDKRALLAYPQAVVDQAVAACHTAFVQAGAPAGPTAGVSQQEIQSRLALARCARSHGIPSFPDPNPSTGEITLPPGISLSSPQLLAAAQACRSLVIAAGFSVPGNPGDASS